MNNLIRLRDGRLYGVLSIACILAGCSGVGFTASTPTSQSAPAVVPASPTSAATTKLHSNSALQIAGAAATSVTVGQNYRFQPRATDTGNDVLTFAISGAPTWTTFDSATGRIAGTPTSADVGVDKAIVLRVSNATAIVYLAPFTITVLAAPVVPASSSGNVSVAWIPPTENTDGSVLMNLGGYVIHYGTASKTYTSTITLTNPGLTLYVIESLPAGTYYFAMTARTTSGVESSLSAEASTTIS
jgi:Putative Ig domain